MDIQNAYNEWSDSYDTNKNLTRDLDATVTREVFAGHQFDAILEIGCGTGKNTAFFAEISRQVHAFDFSEGMILKAKSRLKATHVRFTITDLTKRWECEEGIYDLVSSNLVLEHIADLHHIFTEASRALRPGGQFFINELHPFRQYMGKKAHFEQNGETVEVDTFLHHISDFTNAAKFNNLQLTQLNEYWHVEDTGKPPRLISLIFEKAQQT